MDLAKTKRFLVMAVSTIVLVIYGVEGTATLRIKLIEFRNDAGQDDRGQCCDFLCISKCDHILRFCLDEYHRYTDHVNYDVGSCPYWGHSSGRLQSGKRNYFRDLIRIGDVSNPLIHHTSRWPGQMVFKVLVEDSDRGNGDDGVDKLFKVLELTRAKSESEALWLPMSVTGIRDENPTNLDIRVQLFCDPRYYGLDCSTVCVPQDGSVGHYTCDSETGAKVCLPEWEDPSRNCMVYKDNCMDSPCHSGTCVDLLGDYECVCPPAYTGRKCNVEIDHCGSSPCTNSALCLNREGGYVCQCSGSFVGTNCELHICDIPEACAHGGTCVGGGECYCAPGFTGQRCETDMCELLTCQHGGRCVLGACLCPQAYTGAECESLVDPCERDAIICVNGGTCFNGLCVCPRGYVGTICEGVVDNCLSRPCLHDGTCYSNVGAGYICDCFPGYTGRSCEQRIVPDDPVLVTPVTKSPVPRGSRPTISDPQAVRTEQPTGGFAWWIYVVIGIGVLLVLALVVIAVLVSQYKRKKRQLRDAETVEPSPETFENPVYHTDNIYENTPATEPTYGSSIPSAGNDVNLNIVPQPATYAATTRHVAGAHGNHGDGGVQPRRTTPPGGLKTPKHLEDRYKAMQKASAASLKK